ncbi:PAS domain-containing protein [Geomonas sp. Red69]|uniref:PAS domain-containing protein n=1 Tax=Geomonas diazotrophica TaxID=2843197 RepID=A0ABX8JHN6_9BACT|nr:MULTISPECIES: PAS domain-containing protein [Geomonas]MBU5637435.1 PAS domain-containing protein [Geomonas diazotrophica]QWV97898.1 PAS domain-containing protein [Geomonas nitrogeniifigens]QXE87038.1 PAS domain-containing protein [Geomonas nitrogeniifigens]
MTFALRLKIISLLSFTLLVIVTALLAWSSRELTLAERNHLVADKIQSTVFNRATMRDEYFLFGIERARQQWFSMNDAAIHLLAQGAQQFDGTEEQGLVRARLALAESVQISKRLVEQMRRVPVADPAAAHHDEFASRLYSQIMLSDSALQREAVSLQQYARDRFQSASNRMIYLTLLLVILMALVTILNSAFLNGVLHRRMAAIKRGAEVIASGDLNSGIEVEGNDELSELARLFNSVTCQIRDYTQALHDSEKRYRMQLQELANIYTHTPVGLFAVDRDLRFLRLNEHLARLNGKSICEHVGRTVDEVLAPELVVHLKELWRPILERGECVRDVELQGRVGPAEKDQRYWLASYQPLLSEAGEVSGLMGVVLDITERKVAEEMLAGARQHLEEEVQQRTAKLQLTNEHLIQEIEIRKKVEVELLAQQQKLQDMSLDLAMAEERERDRIASELHDQVGQRLILAKIKLDALASGIPAGECECEAAAVGTLVQQTIQDIRSLTFQIRPPLLASAGLEAALRWLGEELHADFGLEAEFCDDGKDKTLPYEIRSTVFQAVRELMLNVIKHAGTLRCRVVLSRSDGGLVIAVDDDGVGYRNEQDAAETRSGGFGLANVRQKIQHLGGSFSVTSKETGGTVATIKVPLGS